MVNFQIFGHCLFWVLDIGVGYWYWSLIIVLISTVHVPVSVTHVFEVASMLCQHQRLVFS